MNIRIALVMALGALPLVLSACGGGGGDASASSATTPTTSSGASGANARDASAFRECLSEHGVDLPEGFGGGPGRGGAPPSGSFPDPGEGGGPPQGGGFPGGGRQDNPEFQKAMEACSSKLPAGDRGGFGGQNSQVFQAYTSCLQDHGVTVPTGPTGATGATGSAGPGGLRNLQSDPKFAEANKTCRALLPARTGGNGGTSTTVGS